MYVEISQARQQFAPILLAAPQRGQQQIAVWRRRLLRQGQQRRMRPNLEGNPEAIIVQRLHAIRETDRLAHVFAPVRSASGASPFGSGRPMRFHAIGMAGADIVTFRASASMRSSAGSTSGECAASETNSLCPTTLRRAKAASTVSTADVSPEITTLPGALMAAMATRSRRGAIAASMSFIGANKERWNQKELSDLARHLRELADALEEQRGSRKKAKE